MSQFGNPGITQSLDAPGIIPAPPSRGMDLVAQWINAIGKSDVIEMLAAAGEKQRREDEEAAKEDELLLRGDATLKAGTWRSGFLDTIEKGELVSGDTPEANQALAEKIIEQAGTQFAANVQRDEFRKLNLIWVNDVLENDRRKREGAAMEVVVRNVAASLSGATDPAKFDEAFAYGRDVLKLSDAENYDMLLQSLDMNAERGDAAAVDALTSWFPAGYELEKLKAQNAVDGVTAGIEREKLEALENETGADLIAWRDGKLSRQAYEDRLRQRYAAPEDQDILAAKLAHAEAVGEERANDQRLEAAAIKARTEDADVQHIARLINDGQYEEAIAVTDRSRRDGRMSETTAGPLLDKARSRIEERQSAIRRQTADRVESTAKNLHVRDTLSLLQEGASHLVAPLEVTMLEGTPEERTVSMTEEAALEQATNLGMAEIAERFGDDQQGAIIEQVRFLGANGLTYKPWKTALQSAARAVAFDITGRAGEKDALSKGTIEKLTAAAGLYQQLDQLNATLAIDHLDAPSRAFWELMDANFKFGPDEGDLIRSASAAARIMNDRELAESRRALIDADVEASIRESVNKFDFKEWRTHGLRSFGKGDVRNRETLGAIAIGRAELLAMLGLSSDDAEKLAIASLRRDVEIVNNFGVLVQDTRLPRQQIPLAGDAAIEDYWARRSVDMEAQGISRDELTIVPDTENTWIVVSGATGLPVPNWSEDGEYSNARLVELIEANEAQLDDEEAQRRTKASATRFRPRRGESFIRDFFFPETLIPGQGKGNIAAKRMKRADRVGDITGPGVPLDSELDRLTAVKEL